MVFTWDRAKAASNRRKHGVGFEHAVRVFDDPLHLTVQDRIENNEQRWQTIGRVHGAVILLVAHTITEGGSEPLETGPVETIRIISPRAATRRERKLYANG